MPNEMQELIAAAKVISEYGSKCKSANCRVDLCHHWRALYAAIEAAELARASEERWIDHTPDYLLGRCIPFLDTAAYYGNKDAKELRGEIVNYTFDLPSPPLSVEKDEVEK